MTFALEPALTGAPSGSDAGRALDRLAAEHYGELLAIARRERRRLGGAATLDTRGVLHEAFLRLADQRQARWDDRPHFLAAAAGMMRRVLVDHVRRRRATKRGGARPTVTLEEGAGVVDVRDESLVALDEALTQLAELAPRLAQVVECRYFGGMTEGETAEALGVNERTVRRDWIKARGWLHAALAEGG
jgi:RNA polymerase sigma factor (TIGR02999 family)